MSYSCSDFTDNVLNEMARRGFIDGERIPADDPEAQANLVFDAIDHWANERKALRDALRECITDTPGAACYNTGKKTRRLQAINETVIAALKEKSC